MSLPLSWEEVIGLMAALSPQPVAPEGTGWVEELLYQQQQQQQEQL